MSLLVHALVIITNPPQTLQNIIKDIHSAVVDNDIETLMEKSSSVPAVLLSSKDTNGLTPLHKVRARAYQKMGSIIVSIALNNIPHHFRLLV